MKMSRLTFVPVVLALVLGLAACGGGGDSSAKLETNDVAVVGDTTITKEQFDDLMSTAKASFEQQQRKFPKQGTSEYATIKSQAVTLLISRPSASRRQRISASR